MKTIKYLKGEYWYKIYEWSADARVFARIAQMDSLQEETF